MKTALYRHFDADGKLLYVGISLSAVNRLSEHRNSKWAADIAHVTVEWFDDRAAAVEAERKAIIDECPNHNTVHNTKPRSPNAITRRAATPGVPRWVPSKEHVAAHFCVSLRMVERMVKDGMPREHLAGHRYRYDLTAIEDWCKRNAEQSAIELKAKETAKREAKAVTIDQMREALSKIGTKVAH